MSITKCKNTSCPLASKCYRVGSKPNPIMQPYNIFTCKIEAGVICCEHFMCKIK